MSNNVTYTAVLDVRRETVEHLAKLLSEHRGRLGTRKGTRALSVFTGWLAALGLASTARPRTRHHLRPSPRAEHRAEPTRRHARPAHAGRPRIRKRRQRLPSPGQEAQGRRTRPQADDVQQGHPRRPQRRRARQRLLKTTFKALRRVSLDPGSITRIARAALVLLQLEHGRTC